MQHANALVGSWSCYTAAFEHKVAPKIFYSGYDLPSLFMGWELTDHFYYPYGYLVPCLRAPFAVTVHNQLCINLRESGLHTLVLTGHHRYHIIHGGFVLYIMYDMAHRRHDIDAIIGIPRYSIPIQHVSPFMHYNTFMCIIWMWGVSWPWWPIEVWFVGPMGNILKAQMNFVQYCIYDSVVPASMITIPI